MINVAIYAKRVRTIQPGAGYITIEWMSPRHRDGFKRLLIMHVEGRRNDR